MGIKKATAIYLFGEILARMVPFFLMPYLTRKLGASGFGELSLFYAWVAILVIGVSYLQEGALIRYVYYYGRRSVGLILISGRIYSICFTGVILILCIIFKSKFAFIITLAAFSASLLKTELTMRQAFSKPSQYIFIQILSGILSTVLTIVFFEFVASSSEQRMIAVIISNFVCVTLAIGLFSKRLYRFRWNSKRLKLGFIYIVSFSSPLILNSLSSFAKGQFDRLLIANIFTTSELGLYSAAFQLSSVLMILQLAISRAFIPICYSKFRENTWNLSNILKLSIISFPVLMLIFIVSLLIPESLFIFILGSEFNGIKYFTCQFIFAFCFVGMNMFYSIYLNYYGKTKEIMISNVTSVGVYLFFLYLFSGVGIKYIAYSTVISNIILLCMGVFFSLKHYSEKNKFG